MRIVTVWKASGANGHLFANEADANLKRNASPVYSNPRDGNGPDKSKLTQEGRLKATPVMALFDEVSGMYFELKQVGVALTADS